MAAPEAAALRRNDYSLSEDQRAVRDAFADFFGRECPTSRVRAAEPGGFDETLWHELARTDAITMGVAAELGGADASLVDLALVAEQYGHHLAPAPLIEAAVALRLLAASSPDSAVHWVADASRGGAPPTLALQRGPSRQLIPGGAVATGVIALRADELVLITADKPPPFADNQGRAPLAWWDLSHDGDGVTVLARGQPAHRLYSNAVREWKLLTAAALVGLSAAALQLALAFVQDRRAFGTPIGAFQAVSHPLADVHTAVVGARYLTWKAAWFAENEPAARPDLIPMAFVHASRSATKATTVGVHTQGGFGFTQESDMQLFFRRAKGWSVVAGDPRSELSAISLQSYPTVDP